MERAINARSTSPTINSSNSSRKRMSADNDAAAANCSFQSGDSSSEFVLTTTNKLLNGCGENYLRASIKTEPMAIIQEQFEKYPYLDTEDVVKQV